MTSNRALSAALVACLGPWVACSGAPSAAPRASLLSGLVAQPPFTSPAHWDYHPRGGKMPLRSSAAVGEGRLYVNERGERWLSQPHWPQARVAPVLAPEPLVSAVDLGAEGWLFVGAMGSTFGAKSPLGDFETTTTPPVPMAEVAVTQKVLLGITRTQGLMRSLDRGQTWQDVAIEGRAADVALTHSGAGLLLLAPERLLQTSDYGEHWQAMPEAPFGALALESGVDVVRVQGVLETRKFSPGKQPAWERVNSAASADAELDGGRRARAGSVAAGHAAFAAGRYFELDKDEHEHWQLWFGTDVDVLQRKPARTFDECDEVHLAAASDALVVACGEGGDGVEPLRVYTSRDAGASWQQEPVSLRADFENISLAVLEGGRWVIGGICPPEVTTRGCLSHGVYARKPAPGFANKSPAALPSARVQLPAAKSEARDSDDLGEKNAAVLAPVAVPLLDKDPLGLGVSADGERLLVLGGRTKGKSLFAFTSNPQLTEFHVEKLIDIAQDWGNVERGVPVNIDGIASGPDGRFGVSVFDRVDSRRLLLVLEADGRLSSVGRPPVDGASVAAAGAFALAIEPRSREAWESLDGGVSWETIGKAPAALCAVEQQRCTPTLSCWTKGCVADAQYSRIGWRGQQGKGTSVAQPATEPGAAESVEPLGVSIGCRFTEDSQWQRYPGSRLPSADQAQLGAVSWFSVDLDLDRSAAASYVATDSGGPHARRVALLEPHATPRDTALVAQLQVEGAAALRVIAGQAPEVAWHNFFDGVETQRGHLPKGVNVPFRATRWQSKLAEPGLLSVSQRGLFVRPDPPTREAVTYFVTGGKTQALPALVWPRIDSTARAEMVYSDGAPLGLTVIDAGAALVRVRLSGGRWLRDAMALGLHKPQLFEIRQAFDLAYSGGVPGFHLMFLDTGHSTAWWFPFAAGDEPLGTGVEVPTQRDLVAEPSVCQSAERASSPRVVVPAERGTRHAVVVTHTTEPISVLRTEDAVLFGAPGRPCVAAYEAAAPNTPVGSEAVALIAPDPARGSWLFRRSAGTEEFEARRMACGFDASLEAPAEVMPNGRH